MALRTTVKLSSVNNLSDARYAAGMGAGLVGFCLDRQAAHFIEAPTAVQIAGWLVGVGIVGEISSFDAEQYADYPIDYWETDREELLPMLRTQNQPIIFRLAFAEATPERLSALAEGVAYFSLTHTEDQLAPADMARLTDLAAQFPILLGFGVFADNINALLDQTAIAGIVLQGGDEIRPGLKDYDQMADILEAIEVDEAY
jgi:phosphoribosylanthranilate isomerase